MSRGASVHLHIHTLVHAIMHLESGATLRLVVVTRLVPLRPAATAPALASPSGALESPSTAPSIVLVLVIVILHWSAAGALCILRWLVGSASLLLKTVHLGSRVLGGGEHLLILLLITIMLVLGLGGRVLRELLWRLLHGSSWALVADGFHG